MGEFLEWKYINEEQVAELERIFDHNLLTKRLIDIFELNDFDEQRRNIKAKFHLYNYAYCRKASFNSRKTSVFLSILEEVFRRDAQLLSCEKSLESSFDFFEQLVLAHSVERPPVSIKIFDRWDVEPLVEYALTTYFRNLKLYSYVFGVQARVFITQRVRGGVETPSPLMALSLATEILPPPGTENNTHNNENNENNEASAPVPVQ